MPPITEPALVGFHSIRGRGLGLVLLFALALPPARVGFVKAHDAGLFSGLAVEANSEDADDEPVLAVGAPASELIYEPH